MNNEKQLSFAGLELPNELKITITAYNKVSIDLPLKKIFYLQKINHLTRDFMSKADKSVIEWYHQNGPQGLEQHLQAHGIHRDASELLLSIEFAQAVAHCSYDVQYDTYKSFHQSLRARDKTCVKTNRSEDEIIKEYCENNLRIWAFYFNDEHLKNKILRQLDFLALIYAKMEAINALIEQKFTDYTTWSMSTSPSNNQNFIFTVSDQTLVLRVEDRASLDTERQLHMTRVSTYFVEEYVTLMVPFGPAEQKVYRPVVVSALAQQGDLKKYARYLSTKDEQEIHKKTVRLFKQMADFCLELKESGHYHPDIKLTNFLVHNGNLRISDRKTLISIEKPKANMVCSSYNFAPPEYQKCFKSFNNGRVIAKASKIHTTEFDMNSFMSYQLGGALNAFMLKIQKHQIHKDNKVLAKPPVAESLTITSLTEKNLNELIQALTKSNPSERLSIKGFKTLLEQINNDEDKFINELNRLAPANSSEHLKKRIKNPNHTQAVVRDNDIPPLREEDKHESFVRLDTNQLNIALNKEKIAMAIESMAQLPELGPEPQHELKKAPSFKLDPQTIKKQVACGDEIPRAPKENVLLNSILYSAACALIGAVLGAGIAFFIPAIGTITGILIAAAIGAGISYGLYQLYVHQVHRAPLHAARFFKPGDTKRSMTCKREDSLNSAKSSSTGSSYERVFEVLGRSANSSSGTFEHKELSITDVFTNPLREVIDHLPLDFPSRGLG